MRGRSLPVFTVLLVLSLALFGCAEADATRAGRTAETRTATETAEAGTARRSERLPAVRDAADLKFHMKQSSTLKNQPQRKTDKNRYDY